MQSRSHEEADALEKESGSDDLILAEALLLPTEAGSER